MIVFLFSKKQDILNNNTYICKTNVNNMEYTLNDIVKDRKLASYRVSNWIGIYTKQEICYILGISRPTLDSRLEKHTWKMNELKIIIKKLPF